MNTKGNPHNYRFRASANALALAKSVNHGVPVSKRTRGTGRMDQGPFMPPEDWHEPTEEGTMDYRVIVQPPGPGYRHAVTPAEIRDRLAQLPEWMLLPLEVVKLARMTRKKQTFPCYGMQWGASLYLYPIEESLIEVFGRPPKPSVYNESKQYGGRWVQVSESVWHLCWTERALRDFYLNNILLHELGHLLDDRNASYVDRERYAEWFAIQYGLKPTARERRAGRKPKRVVRRHHAK